MIRTFIRYLLITLSLTFLYCFSMPIAAAKPMSNSAIVIPIQGAIGPAMQDFVERGLKSAQAEGAPVVVITLDTPGGLSSSMRGIIKAILASSVPVITYVSPSGARAASAGTYILYASHIAAMAPGTNLGAATPVSLIGMGQAGKKDKQKPSASEMKALNDAKAYIRSLAQLRGRNVKWAERAVSHAESLSAKDALRKHVINLIANNTHQLLAKVNGKIVKMYHGKKYKLHTKDLSITTLQADWRSRFLAIITNPSVAYILLIAGFYGLFFEFTNPGLVAPGVIGGIALLLGLYALQLLPINYAGLGLIILGLGFIITEAFLPSFGILGIGGIISFVVGSILLLEEGTIGYTLPLQLIIGVTIVTVAFCTGVLFYLYRSRQRPKLSGIATVIDTTGTVVESDHEIWVRVNGELWKAESTDELKKGDAVRVLSNKGLLLLVELVNK